MRTSKIAVLTSHPIQYQTPLFRMLRKSGLEVTVYFCWNREAKGSFDKEFGQKVEWDIPLLEGYNFKFLKNFSPNPSSEFWGQINPSILGELARGKYDAVLVYGWNSFTNWLVFWFLNKKKTKILLRGENPLNQEFGKSKWKLFLKKFILRGLFERIDRFLYIGEENKKFYKFYGAPDEKLYSVPYAVENERFLEEAAKLLPNKDNLRKDLGILSDDIVLLFAGKLIEKKRPFDLLSAYEKIKNPKKALIFLGDGELAPRLKDYCRKENVPNVKFIGFKNQTELPRYYAASDILVLPSGAGETWGLVVNEAMCFGLPIIVSDIVGCGPDLVKNGENGFIFPVGETEALKEKIEVFFKNKENLKKYGEKSQEIISHYRYKEDVNGIKEAIGL